MNAEKWQKIKPILEEALELDPDARIDFLKKVCDDEPMRLEAESFLNFGEKDADLFDQSAYDIVTENGNGLRSRSFIGHSIGRYKVTAELGVGGMGTVFLAERADGEFEQKVALKLIKGGISSDSILRRFVSERQILASLDHPNIAHLIDGGTTDEDLPYFVMEYVDGTTILDFARAGSLGLTERLDLFRKVCSAVSFAHQNLIIHRDLKPSNILINTAGVPKLLDFGIAKLLKPENDGDLATQHFVFTPEYASPEQIRGENLTTATDVYSLGVILYELLTGVRPFVFDDKNFGQMVDVATLAAPIRPSAAPIKRKANVDPSGLPFSSLLLTGDLDNVILKALKKEPDRRYSSVEQFSEDIRRHLKGLPVFARKDTWRYRAERFTHRNRLLVGSVALAFVILIAGIMATTILAKQANIERERSERRFKDVRAMANSLIFEVNQKIDESPIKARELLVTRAIEYLDKLANEAEEDASLQAELASSYEKIGDVQAYHYGSGIGDTAGALQNHEKALRIREKLATIAPRNIEYKLGLASSYLRIADLSATAGKTPFALENYDKAVTTISAAYNESPTLQNKRELARAYAKLGQGILRSGSISRSLENYEKAATLVREVAANDPTNTKLQHEVSVYESYTGYAKLEMGRTEESLGHFSAALKIDEHIWQADQDSLENRRNLAGGEQWVGFALRHLLRFDESRAHLQKALDVQQKIYETDKSNVGDINSLADCNIELGWTISESGKPREAVKYLETGISLYETVAKTDPNNLSALRQISFSRRNLADAFAKAGNITGAVLLYEKALRETEALIQQDGKNNEFQYDKAICLSRLGEHGSNALKNLRESIQIFERLVAESPEHQRWQNDLEHARQLSARSI